MNYYDRMRDYFGAVNDPSAVHYKWGERDTQLNLVWKRTIPPISNKQANLILSSYKASKRGLVNEIPLP
jgi:hypothetical protein